MAKLALDRETLPTGAAVQDLLRQVQSDLPSVKLARFSVAQETEAKHWLSQQHNNARGALVCGYAHARGRAVIVAGDRLGSLARADQASFSVALQPSVSVAYGFAITQSGQVRHAPVQQGRLTFDVEETLVSVQVVGQTIAGPLPIASFYPQGPDATRKSQTPPNGAKIVDVYQWYAALYQRFYMAAAVRPVPRSNRRLVQAAEKYAKTLLKSERVTHGADGRSATERVSELGLESRDVGEVLACAPTLAMALGGLLESPSHRLVLLDTRMTDVGFGVANHAGTTCVVGLFASWPRAVR